VAGSCVGKCGKYTSGATCQCDSGCAKFGDCCKDYKTECACKDDKGCDDGTPCTKDTCDKGACKNEKIKCDDNNACTTDLCSKTQGCVYTPDVTGKCDDGNVCTSNDTCVAGTCAGTKKNCDDQNPCTTDNCLGGGCTNVPVTDGQACGVGKTCTQGKCVGKKGDCAAGVCCDVANAKYRPKGYECSPNVADTQHQCVGQMLQKRTGTYGCNGVSASACSADPANISWKQWQVVTTCPAGQTCDAKGKTCVQGNPGGDCQSGACCDVATKKFKAKGTKCGIGASKTEYQCLGTKTVQRRQAFRGCTGKVDTCSTSTTDYVWDKWATHTTCKTGTSCVKSSSTYAYCKNDGGTGGKADLIPTQFVATGSTTVNAGSSISIRYTRKNQGGAATGDFHDGYYLSKNSIISTGDTLITSVKRSPMKAGETKGPYLLSLKIPANTASGTYYLGYYVDHKSEVSETLEGNNTKSLKITVKGSGTGAPCTTGICCDVAKKTIRPKGYKCSSSLAKTEYKCVNNTVQRRLAYRGCNGTSASFCSALTTNYSWTPWVLFRACKSGESCVASGTTSATCKTSGTKKADLAPTFFAPTGSTTVQAGKTISVRYTRKNLGTATSGAFHDAYLLSTNNIISNADTLLKSYARSSMTAGHTVGPLTITLTIPATTKAGTYYLGYYVDHKSAVSESNESNNTRSFKITVTTGGTVKKADLTPTFFAPTGSSTVKAGSSISMRYTRKNQGTLSSGAFDDGYYLSTNSIISTGDTLLKTYGRTSMTAGASAGPYTVTLTIPATTKAGTYYLGYYVDHKFKVSESSESNNTRNFKITVTGTTAQCSSGICCNTSTKTYRPKGYKCSSTIAKTEYRCLGTKLVQRRRAYRGCTGSSASFCSSLSTNYNWETWKTTQTCSSSQNCSASGTSSASCKTVSSNKPDLTPTLFSPTGSTTVAAGKSISARYTRKNQGKASSGAFDDGYYLSTNSVISTGDKLLKTYSRTSLAAGASAGPYTVTLTIPSSTKPGTYYLGYYVDHKFKVSESTEGNNTRYFKITVTGAAQCTSGVCCNTSTKQFRPKGYKCNSTVRSTQYRCSGTKIRQRRRAYRGCTGLSASLCSTSSTNYSWESWTNYQTCTSSQTCTKTSSTYAYCKTSTTKKADLTPTFFAPTSSSSVKAGSSISVRYTRKNQGTASSGAFDDGYYLSTNTTISTGDKLLKTVARTSMSAGASAGPFTTTVLIPSNTKAGTYYLGYYVDHKLKVSETSESNNTRYFKITVTGGTQCTSGVCCNTFTKQFRPKGYKCNSTVRSTQYRCSGTKYRQRRRAYRGCTGTSGSFCSTLSSNYYWESWTTYQTCSSTQTCTKTSSTYAYCKTTTTKKADLQATYFTVSGSTTITRGKAFTVRYTRRNGGTVSSGSFHDGYFLSTNSTITNSDTLLKSLSRSSMTAGKTSGPYTLSLTLPSNAKTGTMYLGYYVDHKFAVSETSESNNKRYIKITVK